MTLQKYIIGFVLSLIITLIAYFAVQDAWVSGFTLLALLSGLAVVQMIVQLVYFLHLGDEVGPRYQLASFLFMMGILLIIVVGSLWIMHHLNNNMMNMTPTEKSEYMLKQHDKGF
jgi:cytochrome o ubiquinol oxidase operon protein cyoD